MYKQDMTVPARTILAIETSCDETGLAVLRKENDKIEVLSQVVASQIDIHKETGGVVPEVAAREHTKVLRPLLRKVLREAAVENGWRAGGPPTDARKVIRRAPGGGASETGPVPSIDAIAVTVGPGLIPALVVGVTAAQTLAYAWNKPIVPVHHIEGHIYSALLSSPYEGEGGHHKVTEGSFPALALIVSGGHTMLIEVPGHLQYKVIGETRDDAAGEAFDKVARLLQLPYPGGPHLSKLAEQGDSQAFDFPRPMVHSKDLDFSFSGLKTAVLYTLRDNPGANKADVAASFQQAVVDSLVGKTLQAFDQISPKVVLLAGGVAANTLLRKNLEAAIASRGGELRIAPLSLCGDNAVMIGQVGLFALEAGRTISWRDIDAKARINIETTPGAVRSG